VKDVAVLRSMANKFAMPFVKCRRVSRDSQETYVQAGREHQLSKAAGIKRRKMPDRTCFLAVDNI